MKKVNPIVSVIIPVFNAETTIKYVLDDLASQTYLNSEFILINDGSTDSSKKIIENFIAKQNDNRFLLINQKNGGVSSARNTGLSYARGKYVMFADADDRFGSGFVKGYVSQIIRNDTDIEIFSLYKTNNLNNLHVIEEVNYSDEYISYSDFFKYLADGFIHGYVVTYISKRSLWNNIRFDKDIAYREDEFAYCEIIIEHPDIKIHLNSNKYYFYYIHDESSTNNLSPSEVLDSIEISKKIIQKANSKKKLTVSSRRLNQLYSNFYWRMIVVSVLNNDEKYYSLAKKNYLIYYKQTEFHTNRFKRTCQYLLLRCNFDFAVKKLIHIAKD